MREGEWYESQLAELLKIEGYNDVRLTPATGDRGVDILCVDPRTGKRIAIQCKYYQDGHNVGSDAVQEIYTGVKLYNCEIGVIATSTYLTAQARDMASKLGINLWENFIPIMENATPITVKRWCKKCGEKEFNYEEGKKYGFCPTCGGILSETYVLPDRPEPKNPDMWPINLTGEVDVDYYESLPRIVYVDGMKEYIYMTPLDPNFDIDKERKRSGDQIINLISPYFSDELEAEHFARAAERHLCGITWVKNGYVFGKFRFRIISVNWRDYAFMFPNWG